MNNYCADNHKKTKVAFLGTRLLNTPFWAMFNMIPFILFKDLGASPIQITSVLILKPAVSLIAFYWVFKRRSALLKHVVTSHILGFFPFFFLPFIQDPWFIVLAFGFYMTMYRGSIPAWMEILKLNMPGASRSRVFAFGNTCSYVGDALWPLLFGFVLDGYHEAWRWIFPAAALISLTAVVLQLRMQVAQKNVEIPVAVSFRRPWHEAWKLLQNRPDFTRYQIGFMLGGAGLMIMQPAFPAFFMGTLQLSYMELGMAITFCKGIGMAFSSPIWARLIHRVDVYRFASFVTFLAALFPLCVFFSEMNLVWLYLGYILYGVMQAGSELGWNMSGPIFAKKEDSSAYTSVNILTQGVRGCFVPLLGGVLSTQLGPFVAIFAGGGLCLLATWRMYFYSRKAIHPIVLETN